MTIELIKKVNALLGEEVDYLPWNIRDVEIFYGTPPVPVHGLEYVFARHNRAQTKRVGSLTGKGCYVNNINKSGIIEFATLRGTVTGGGVEIAEATGIAFPMNIVDKSSGGTSQVAALSCRRVGTPEWRRDEFPGLAIFTFECDNLVISEGVRLPDLS